MINYYYDLNSYATIVGILVVTNFTYIFADFSNHINDSLSLFDNVNWRLNHRISMEWWLKKNNVNNSSYLFFFNKKYSELVEYRKHNMKMETRPIFFLVSLYGLIFLLLAPFCETNKLEFYQPFHLFTVGTICLLVYYFYKPIRRAYDASHNIYINVFPWTFIVLGLAFLCSLFQPDKVIGRFFMPNDFTKKIILNISIFIQIVPIAISVVYIYICDIIMRSIAGRIKRAVKRKVKKRKKSLILAEEN